LTHPFDVVKTKQQLAAYPHSPHASTSPSLAIANHASEAASSETLLSSPNRHDALSKMNKVSFTSTNQALSSSVQTRLWQILQTEGVCGLYRGLSMRLLTVIPDSAIMITVYETMKNLEF
jgi:hypothetical protein